MAISLSTNFWASGLTRDVVWNPLDEAIRYYPMLRLRAGLVRESRICTDKVLLEEHSCENKSTCGRWR